MEAVTCQREEEAECDCCTKYFPYYTSFKRLICPGVHNTEDSVIVMNEQREIGIINSTLSQT
ncbi:hypothetical protein STEG23_029184, partial [Scotinomys teguina]